jgi:hypothetical protein
MSLINDALKRASETRKQSGDPPPPVTLNPVDYGVRPNPGFRVLVILMLLTAVAFAIWFLSKWQEQSAASAKLHLATNSPPPVSSPPASPVPSPTSNKVKIKVSTNFVIREDLTVAPTPELRSEETVLNQSALETPAPAPPAESPVTRTNAPGLENPAPPPEATNTFPKLKLQSIVYRLSKPAVVINGEMLFTGDTIKEVRVLKIERMAVTLEWHGQTNVLTLPRL